MVAYDSPCTRRPHASHSERVSISRAVVSCEEVQTFSWEFFFFLNFCLLNFDDLGPFAAPDSRGVDLR